MSLDKRSIELGTEGWGVKEDNLLAFRKDRTRYVEKPFTFSRGTAATRVNSSGLIETLHDEATNLLLQSNQFDTTWERYYINTPTNGFAGYDGSSDAWLLQENTDNDNHWIRQSSSITSGIGTFSFYAKKKDYDFIQFVRSGDGSEFANFNINNGTIGNYSGNLIDVNIESKGNGWYRCSVTYSFNTNAFVGIALIRSDVSSRYDVYLGNGTNGTYIQDAQLEAGYIATPYIETTTQAVTQPNKHETPRISYDIVDGVVSDKPHLLLEPARTNLVPYSQSHSDYYTNRSSKTDLGTPYFFSDGSITKFTATAANAQFGRYLSLVSGNTYTFSAYFDASQGVYCGISDSSSNRVIFDITTGSLISATNPLGVTCNINKIGNPNYYRVSFTFTALASENHVFVIGKSDGTINTTNESIAAGYFQIEEGSYATSYIPNYGNANGVTRAAETANNCGASQDFNDDEGVLFAEIAAHANDGYFKEISINDGTFDNTIEIRYNNIANEFQFIVRDGGSATVVPTTILADSSEFIRVGFSYKNNDSNMYINGVQVDTDTTCTMPSGLNRVSFDWNGSNFFYGKVKELKVFTETLNDAELRLLTKYAPKDYDTAFTADYVDSLAEFTVLRTEATDKLYYSISDGTNSVSGSATITATQVTISNIDISSLSDGTLTLSVYIEDERKQRGVTVTDTTIKDTTNTPLYSYALQQRATGATFEDLDNSESIIESLNVEV